MDPELRWLIKLVFAVGSLASLIDAGRRRGWILRSDPVPYGALHAAPAGTGSNLHPRAHPCPSDQARGASARSVYYV